MGRKRDKKPVYQRRRMDSGQHRRILLAMLVLGLAVFGLVIARLYRMMILDYDYYAEKALRNQSRTTRVEAQRGEIYDRNMNILATSDAVETVYLAPRELKQSGADVEAVAGQLGAILKKDPQWIALQARDMTQRYKQIAAQVEPPEAQALREYIQAEQLRGIHLEPATRRYYPYGSLAAQVIGFTNADGKGSEGIEASCNSYLSGAGGKVVTAKGNNELDMPYSYESYIAARKGASVILTLDAAVQACLEKQMEAAIARYDVQNGAFGMVMHCRTGEILAMATLGSYDPNHYQQIADADTRARLESLRMQYEALDPADPQYAAAKQAHADALSAARLKQWRNRCLSDGYEPGSTFKVLTMAAALDCGAIDLNTGFFCSGAEQIPGRSQLLHCWRSTGHGSEQTPQALQNSCNIAFAHIALKLGGERFYEYVEKFGILEKTGIDLAGESKGVFFDKALVVNTQKWGTASLTSGSFGQTFKLTPLQLVRAIASVVNGGLLLEPYLVQEILDGEGNTLLRSEPTVVRRTIRPETSDTMRELITSVVTQGTAKNAAVAGYSIGGKTGTSEKIDVFDENGQRVQDKIVSFVGIAPMEDPEYIVLVALDTPSRQTGMYISGGVMAAPTVGAVFSEILPYLGVAQQFSREEAAFREVVVPQLKGLTVAQVNERLRELGLTARLLGNGAVVTDQLPPGGQSVPGGSELLVYLGEEAEQRTVAVPDFSGMHRQQASDAAGSLGLYMRPAGNPELSPQVTVTAQSIAPGTEVSPGTTLTLHFADTAARD